MFGHLTDEVSPRSNRGAGNFIFLIISEYLHRIINRMEHEHIILVTTITTLINSAVFKKREHRMFTVTERMEGK
jgi:hypothetical protein